MNTHDRLAVRGTFYILLSIIAFIVFAVTRSISIVETHVSDISTSGELTFDKDNDGELQGESSGISGIRESVVELFLSEMTIDEISESYEIQPEGYSILKKDDRFLVVTMEEGRVTKVHKVFDENKTESPLNIRFASEEELSSAKEVYRQSLENK